MSATDPNSPPFNLVYADSIAARVARGGYGYVGKVGVQPAAYVTSAAGIPSFTSIGAAGSTQNSTWGNGPFAVPVEIYVGAAGTARLPLANVTEGLEVQPNLVNNNNVEYVIGGNNNLNPFAHTVGTSPGSFFRVAFKIADVDSYDQVVIGWRKQQGFEATAAFIASTDPLYTDFAAIGFAGTVANPNPVRVMTNLNNQGVSAPVQAAGFTWTDNVTHRLEVRVTGRKALFFINGAQLGNRITKDYLGNTITAQSTTSGPSYSFDSTDVLIPFIFCRTDATVGAGDFIYLVELEVGRLADIGLDNSSRGGVVD